jgi:hypothetical protein
MKYNRKKINDFNDLAGPIWRSRQKSPFRAAGRADTRLDRICALSQPPV